ncbi:MAG: O-antigen ligase family protein [Candidatus Aminicenantes bacterium]|nr:O-antigen ligase family protein [Candidatus Aminicenantes bacterium]
MNKTAFSAVGLSLTAVCFVLYGFFYYIYVPLVASFQLILIPLLLLTLILTLVRIEWGTFWFVFAFPLINNLPYFFGIHENIPHAPVALVLFLAFFLGWMARTSLSGLLPSFPVQLSRPLTMLSLIVVISGLLTFWRYANFPPFLSDGIHELIVNVNGVRAGGAVMSDVFNSLNYLTGFFFLCILLNIFRTWDDARKLLVVFSASAGISLIFCLFQKYVSMPLGNTPTWVGLGQLNSTFKDPNAFGAFLSAVLPVFLGMALSFRKRMRVLFFTLIILTLFIFPSIGSRSGFLAISVSSGIFCVLILFGKKASFKIKIIQSLAILLALVLIISSLSFFQGRSSLFQRLNWNPKTASGQNFVSELFTGKLAVWNIAGHMVQDFPFTGVGMGAYIIELPNYLQSLGRPSEQTDSAENYFFQAGSELGLAGLFLFLYVFFAIFKQMRVSWRRFHPEDKDKYILIGICSGLLALCVNFLFHSYVGSFEVVYTFWILVALVFIGSPSAETKKVRAMKKPSWRMAAVILTISFGTIHLWNSMHSLSLKSQTARFGWNQNFGLYEIEKDPRRFNFRWAKQSAGLTIEALSPSLVIPMRASHPDIEKKPVRVKIFLGDESFRKMTLIQEVVFTKTDWIELEYPVLHPSEKKIYLIVETDRDWQPSKYLGLPDSRSLALALGEAWFKYPSEIPGKKINILETIPSQNWQGQFKENLITNGMSRMNVKIEKANSALRLWVKGQKAMGIGPMIIIRLDGTVIGKILINEEFWNPLILTAAIGVGEHEVGVEFTNDFYAGELGQDRNVFLGDLDIIFIE